MIRSKRTNNQVRVFLNGEIDQYTADVIREELEQILADKSIMHLILDFESVDFMDSSGIGVILGRYKTMKSRGGKVTACGLHAPVDRLFRMAGLHRIIIGE